MQFELLKHTFSAHFALGVRRSGAWPVAKWTAAISAIFHARKHNLHCSEILWQQLKLCSTAFSRFSAAFPLPWLQNRWQKVQVAAQTDRMAQKMPQR